MFHAISNHESRSEDPRGIDPETAASQLREILGASGKGQGILSQQRALLEWAHREKRISNSHHELSNFRPGGLEHLILHDVQGGLVYKLTYGGSFGRTVRKITNGRHLPRRWNILIVGPFTTTCFPNSPKWLVFLIPPGAPKFLSCKKHSKAKYPPFRMLIHSCASPVLSPSRTWNSLGKMMR